MSNWLNKLVAKLQKEALDKLPQEELDGTIPGLNSDAPPVDPNAMMMPPPPMEEGEPEPDVTGNVFEVDVNGIKVKMKLIPELVTKGPEPSPMPDGTATADPMADTSTNPNADPMALAQYLEDPNTEKPFGHNDQGTVEPLSQQDQGIAVHDTGSEGDLAQNQQKVKVHKKPRTAAAEQTPGADRSNPQYPCAACANYIAENGTCSQGIDPIKAQAAKSCSWLNSNFKPFLSDGGQDQFGRKDEETYKNDVSQLPNAGGGGGGRTASLKDTQKKII